jgi:Tol biopolymer transport system component
MAARTAVAVIVVAIAAAAGMRYFPATAPAGHLYRAMLLPPGGGVVYPVLQPAGFLALSPDSTRLAFVASSPNRPQMLWVRSLDDLGAQPLSGTEGANFPFWSPDGDAIAFFAEGRLLRIDARGGPVTTIAASAFAAGGAWNRDGTILFRSPDRMLHRVPSSGGTATPVTALDTSRGEIAHQFPVFLPDGDHFLYSAVGGTPAATVATITGQIPLGLYVSSLTSSNRELVLEDALNVQYAGGHLFYLRGSALIAQPFDLNGLRLIGNAVPVAEEIATGGFAGRTGAFTVSEAGALLYQSGSLLSQLTWFDRSGSQIGTVGEPDDIATLELSSDRAKATVMITDPRTRTRDVWIYDLARGVPARLTFTNDDEVSSVWTPDGKWIIFDSARSGSFDIYRKPVNGTIADELLVGTFVNERPTSVSADGRHVIYEAGSPDTPAAAFGDIWILPLEGERVPFPFLTTPLNEIRPKFSPDGRLVKYESNETGSYEIYISTFPDAGAKVRVSQNGGIWGRWAVDGREMFYMTPDYTLMSASVSVSGGVIHVGTPRVLFATRAKRLFFPYDVSADGQRFLINAMPEDAGAAPLTLLVNWPALLAQ